MSEQTLFRIRNLERQFIAREIDSWNPDHEAAVKVRDLEDLVQACLLDRDKDNSFIRLILDRSRMLDRDGELDIVNHRIQECCDDALATLNKLSERIRLAEGLGYPVEHASSIAKAIEDYRRWKEDVPELLLLNHAPVQNLIRERIKAAIDSPAVQSDWRELFVDDAC